MNANDFRFQPVLSSGALAVLQLFGCSIKKGIKQGIKAVMSSGALAVTDKGAKFKFSGVSVTPERKEHSIQWTTTTLLHQREQRDQRLPCFSPHTRPQPLATPDGLQRGP